MRTIVCVGDSHTWGEGATGVDGAFNPPAIGGDSRPVSFAPPCYVNLLRRALCDSREVLPAALDLPCEGEYAVFTDLSLPFTGAFGRVMLRYHPDGGCVNVALDGHAVAEVDTSFDPSALPPARTAPRTHRFTSFSCGEGEHVLRIRSDRPVYFYRAEFFSGNCAVLNSGVGSCPTGLYLSEYWNEYVACYRPETVVLNPMSINDWIVQTSIPAYLQNLAELIRRTRALGAKPVLLTVAPITGDKYFGDSGIHYDAYIDATRTAAREWEVPLADANRRIREASAECRTEEAFFEGFCHDCWHPNDRGHRLYADSILPLL